MSEFLKDLASNVTELVSSCLRSKPEKITLYLLDNIDNILEEGYTVFDLFSDTMREFNLSITIFHGDDLSIVDYERKVKQTHSVYVLYDEKSNLVYDILNYHLGITLEDWDRTSQFTLRQRDKEVSHYKFNTYQEFDKFVHDLEMEILKSEALNRSSPE